MMEDALSTDDDDEIQYINENAKGVSPDVKNAIFDLKKQIDASKECAMFGMGQKGKLITIEFETGADE